MALCYRHKTNHSLSDQDQDFQASITIISKLPAYGKRENQGSLVPCPSKELLWTQPQLSWESLGAYFQVIYLGNKCNINFYVQLKSVAYKAFKESVACSSNNDRR